MIDTLTNISKLTYISLNDIYQINIYIFDIDWEYFILISRKIWAILFSLFLKILRTFLKSFLFLYFKNIIIPVIILVWYEKSSFFYR